MALATALRELQPAGLHGSPQLCGAGALLVGVLVVVPRGGPISCVIYDKTREIRQQSQKWWFHDLWQANGWDMEEQPVVWRVEFRFKREVLHELSVEGQFEGVEDAFSLLERISHMWAYAAGHVGGGEDGLPDGWLRLVVPGADSNRSRWATHAVWTEVQRAFEVISEGEEQGEDKANIIRKRKYQANLERAVAATGGVPVEYGGLARARWGGGVSSRVSLS